VTSDIGDERPRDFPRALVRTAAPADLGQITAMYAHYVATSVATFETDAPPVAYWRQRLDDLADRNLPFLVAEADDVVVGYSFASPWRPRPAYRYTAEDSVYVAPGQAGRGIGSALLAALLDRCAEAGVHQVIAVIADTGSDASTALHARFGFTHAGRLTHVGRKHGRWIDTVLMQRTLAARFAPT
jgi:L-amino acid N-acyltransferase YncA